MANLTTQCLAWRRRSCLTMTSTTVVMIFLGCDSAASRNDLRGSQHATSPTGTSQRSSTDQVTASSTSTTAESSGETLPPTEQVNTQTNQTTITEIEGTATQSEQPSELKTVGQLHYEAKILPLLNDRCVGCHTDPLTNPPQQGPLTIFSYDAMRQRLLDGSSAADNALMRKVRDLELHGGGNRCPSGPTVSPCRDIAEWWKIERESNLALEGRITSISSTGVVVGYAADWNDPNKSLMVRLMVNGQLAAETEASLDASDANYPGPHAFSVTLPAAVRNGLEHTLQAYVGDVAIGSTMKYTAYTPKDAGRDYFNQTVSPVLTDACGGCHTVDYDFQYSELLSPPPAKGGTATNNLLINTASGGNNHPGGNQCEGANSSRCTLLQNWWTIEFGP